MAENILIGVPKTFVYDVTLNNQGVTGQACKIMIQRAADNYYWTGAIWTVTLTEVAMTEKDSTNYPGVYTYSFTPPTVDTYTVTYRIDSGTYQSNLTETFYADNSVASISPTITLMKQVLINDQVIEVESGETYLVTYNDAGVAGGVVVSKQKLHTFADAALGDLSQTTSPMRRYKVL